MLAMDRRVHIVHLNSQCSLDSHPHNHSKDFTVHLPERLQLHPVGEWTCCLLQCKVGFGTYQNPHYLCCDACDDCIAGDFKLPALATLYQSAKIAWVPCGAEIPVLYGDISDIRIYIPHFSGKLDRSPKLSTVPHCTLRFSRTAPCETSTTTTTTQ